MRGIGLHVALVLTLTLSGCLGGDASGPDEPDETPDDAVLVTDDMGQTRIVRPHLAAFTDQVAYSHVETEDGTFAIGEHDNLHGEFLQEAGYDTGSAHVRDISDKVPSGIPVRIAIEVSAELEEGDLDLWLDLPQEEAWTVSADAPIGGWSRLEYHILRHTGEPIELVVFYDEAEPVQSFDYTLTYEIEAQPFLLVPGIPVTVPVPRGAASIEARFNGTDTGALHVFDPSDDLVARVPARDGTANHTFEPGAPAGDYVVLLDAQATGPAHLVVYAPTDGADPQPLSYGRLTQDIQATDSATFGANEDGEVAFTVDRTPIQVGLQVMVDTTSDGIRATLSSPEGELLMVDASFMPPPLTLGTMGFVLRTSVGAEGLVPGTYTGTFAADTHGAGEVHGWVVHYTR